MDSSCKSPHILKLDAKSTSLVPSQPSRFSLHRTGKEKLFNLMLGVLHSCFEPCEEGEISAPAWNRTRIPSLPDHTLKSILLPRLL